jgi:hypothetical protein
MKSGLRRIPESSRGGGVFPNIRLVTSAATVAAVHLATVSSRTSPRP